jgi:molybdopterin-containing oxidoreductase family iron-sulfur binding subunit
VEILLILGGNPVFTAPVDLGMRSRLGKARLRMHLSLYDDETSEFCQWHLPLTHFLETWSDARTFDGTATIMQPLIDPLYEGRSMHQVLAMFADQPELSPHDIVKNYWRGQYTGSDFQGWWRKAVHDGVVPNSALPAKTPAIQGANIKTPAEPKRLGGTLEVNFRTDPAIYDGRFANNGWLQELPKPITKLTWDNAAFIGPGTAHRLGV